MGQIGATPELSDNTWRSDLPYIVRLADDRITVAYLVKGDLENVGDGLNQLDVTSDKKLWLLVDHFFISEFIAYVGTSRYVTPENVIESVSIDETFKILDSHPRG